MSPKEPPIRKPMKSFLAPQGGRAILPSRLLLFLIQTFLAHDVVKFSVSMSVSPTCSELLAEGPGLSIMVPHAQLLAHAT